MKDVVVVSGARTAIGGFGGGLKDVPVVDLGAVVMKDVLKRINLSEKDLQGIIAETSENQQKIEYLLKLF